MPAQSPASQRWNSAERRKVAFGYNGMPASIYASVSSISAW